MKVLLCYPSLLPGQKPTYGLQPLGILHIGAVLQQHGVDVKILDADIDGLTIEETVGAILSWEPDLVGFSMMTPQLIPALEISAQLKEARPDLWIVLGGAHICSTHEDVFDMADCFDLAVYGEGEMVLLEIVQNAERYGREDLIRCVTDVPNVIYRDKSGQIIKNPPQPFIPDLNALPPINYDLVDLAKYSIPTLEGQHVISMMLSRGCPFNCIFCDAPTTMGRGLRLWSVEQAIDTIRACVDKYGCHSFTFRDSTFTANQKWSERFCDALIDSGLNIKWRCGTRVNLVPQRLLTKMKAAGCYTINFGVESGDPRILKTIRKEVNIDEIYDAHQRCRELGIRTYTTFLIGSPGETEESIRATINVARNIRTSLAMFFVCTAYPGTYLYELAVKEGLVQPRWWASQVWDSEEDSAFGARWGWTDQGAITIPGLDLERWQKRATRAFYLRPAFVWDTLVFTIKNPYFWKHIINLGMELIPFYKIPMPWAKSRINEQHRRYARCPSASTWDYEYRDSAETR